MSTTRMFDEVSIVEICEVLNWIGGHEEMIPRTARNRNEGRRLSISHLMVMQGFEPKWEIHRVKVRALLTPKRGMGHLMRVLYVRE